MEKPFLSKIFKDSLLDFSKNLILVIPSFILFLLLVLISKISVKINYTLSNSITITLWFILFSLIYFLIISFISSGMIGLSKSAVLKKAKLSEFLIYGKRFWLKNFIILVLFFFIFAILIGLLALYTKLMILLTPYFSLSEKSFKVTTFVLYFIYLIGIVIFFTFSNFFLVINNLKIKESILNSFILVKRNYLSILSISIIFSALFYLTSLLNDFLANIINFIILIPYLTLILTRFLIVNALLKK